MADQLEIQQGATFRCTVEWREANGTPITMAGRSARMHFRRRVADEAPLLSLTSAALGGLTIHPAGAIGDLAVYISATATTTLPAIKVEKPGVWDIELFDPNDVTEVTRLAEGTFIVTPEVTR